MKINHRIWFELDSKLFGKGPARLLQVVSQTHSLREAARQLGLSYTKAFQMIKTAEEQLGYPLLKRTIGGPQGGGSILSEQALILLQDFSRLDEMVGVYAHEQQQVVEQARLEELFREQGKGVVSVIGGGGKTTLVNYLTKLYSAQGPTLLTSTTAMFHPDFLPVDFGELKTQANPVALFSQMIREDKLKGIEPEEVDELKQSGRFRLIVVEADGSKGLPFKAYADHEPPIPQSSDLVVLVMGVDGFLQPIEEVVHRPQIFASITQSRLRDPLTPENYLQFYRHEMGTFKNVPDCPVIVLLNRIDQIKNRGILKQLIPGLLNEPRVIAVGLSNLAQSQLETSFFPE